MLYFGFPADPAPARTPDFGLRVVLESEGRADEFRGVMKRRACLAPSV